MAELEQLHDTALRSANLALAGRRHAEPGPFGAVELRLDDPRAGAWEIAALASVAVASALLVVGLWFW
jgi:hypothetical protein